MDKFKNEHGAALVLTLFIVTLMLLFTMTLFYQVTNTTRQVTTVEKNIDARNIAEMGVEYYYQMIKYGHEQKPTTDIEDIIKRIEDEKVIFNNRSFKLIQVEFDDPNKINITCKGTAFGQEAMVENEITLVEK